MAEFFASFPYLFLISFFVSEAFRVFELGLQQLIEFCRGKIATYKLPREIVIVSELPRTPTGKLLRRVLRQREVEQAKAAS